MVSFWERPMLLSAFFFFYKGDAVVVVLGWFSYRVGFVGTFKANRYRGKSKT